MIALLLACTTGTDEPTDTSASDSPAGDSADSGDTGETADTGSGGTGLLLLVGSATVDGAWDLAGNSADTIAAIAGTTRTFGIALDYYGDSDVLLYWKPAAWDGAASAD